MDGEIDARRMLHGRKLREIGMTVGDIEKLKQNIKKDKKEVRDKDNREAELLKARSKIPYNFFLCLSRLYVQCLYVSVNCTCSRSVGWSVGCLGCQSVNQSEWRFAAAGPFHAVQWRGIHMWLWKDLDLTTF